MKQSDTKQLNWWLKSESVEFLLENTPTICSLEPKHQTPFSDFMSSFRWEGGEVA